MVRTIIPATPGWAVVEGYTDDDGVIRELYAEPVIAWLVLSSAKDESYEGEKEGNHQVVGLTVEGVLDEDKGQMLKRPDDTYIAPWDGSFDTDEQVLKYLNEREQHRREYQRLKAQRAKEQKHG